MPYSADSPIKYQGRKAQRSDSRERRRAILEGALRVIARDGIRGVRHRAVAKEAGVPLASTTYYFKDIQELIADAFRLFTEDNMKIGTLQVREHASAILNRYSPEDLRNENARRALHDDMSEAVVRHIEKQILEVERRKIEQAFRHEALLNPLLAEAVTMLADSHIESIQVFFALVGSRDPEADAAIIFATILRLEYIAIISEDRFSYQKTIRRVVRRLMASLLRLPDEVELDEPA